MINDKETCCFLHIVKNVLSSDGYYLLPIKDYGDIQPDKVFMGYYDENYIYLVPKRIVHGANKFAPAAMTRRSSTVWSRSI